MPQLRRSFRSVFLMGSLLLALVAVPCRRTWQLYSQQRLNHDLISAVKNNNAAEVKKVLIAGANPDVRDKSEEVVSWWQMLYRYFRKETHIEEQGETALTLAIQTGANNIVALLLQQGAHVNASNGEGRTALMDACVYERASVALQLISAGANVNQADKYGGTALLSASFGKSPSLVRLLLEHGASIHVEVHGWTPLRYAVDSENVPMVKFLLAHHADTEFYDYGSDGTLLDITWTHEQTPAKQQIRRLLKATGVKAKYH